MGPLIGGAELVELRDTVAALRSELAATQEDLDCAIEAYECLDRIHTEVCAECNELSEQNAILKQDLDDATDEFEGLSADYAVAFDVLAEHGLIEEVEVEDAEATSLIDKLDFIPLSGKN